MCLHGMSLFEIRIICDVHAVVHYVLQREPESLGMTSSRPYKSQPNSHAINSTLSFCNGDLTNKCHMRVAIKSSDCRLLMRRRAIMPLGVTITLYPVLHCLTTTPLHTTHTVTASSLSDLTPRTPTPNSAPSPALQEPLAPAAGKLSAPVWVS